MLSRELGVQKEVKSKNKEKKLVAYRS